MQPNNPHPPLIVLSGHRAGSSAVMRVFASFGLHLGDVLPPRRDNPLGFFESTHITQEHQRILRAMDRDWTCPPVRLSSQAVVTERLEGAIKATIGDATGPWGFKDPRTLFLLEAWGSILPSMRLVGVYRSTEAISKSLQARNGMSPEVAMGIAVVYNQRLADLHEALGFPLVGFDVPDNDLAARLLTIARFADLEHSEGGVEHLIDTTLIHHRGDVSSELDEQLVAASREPIDSDFIYAQDEIVRGHLTLPLRADGSNRRAGPSFDSRRAAAIAHALDVRTEVGRFLELSPTPQRPSVPAGVAPELYEWVPAGKPDDIRKAAASGAFTHVIGVDVLEAVAPAALAPTLEALADATDGDAVVVLGGSLRDAEGPIDTFFDDRRQLVLATTHEPFFHHRFDLDHALAHSTWALESVQGSVRVQLRLTRSKTGTDDAGAMPGSQLRASHHDLATRLHETERELDLARQQLASANADLQAATAARMSLEAELASAEEARAALVAEVGEVHQRLEAAYRERDEGQRRLDAMYLQLEAMRGELATAQRELATAESELEAATATLESERTARDEAATARDEAVQHSSAVERHAEEARVRVDYLENRLDATSRSYERLANRRSVKAALAVASLAKPGFRLWRKARGSVTPQSGSRSGHATGQRQSTTAGEAGEEPALVAAGQPPPDLDSPIQWPQRPLDRLPDVTIVIPVYNAFEALQRCIASVMRNTTYPADLLLINDGSSDERIVPFLDGLDVPGVRILHNEENVGFVKTVNRGFAETDTDVVLLNADVEVVPGWLQRLVATGARDPSVATVTPLSNNADAFSAPIVGEECETPKWLDRDGVGRLVAQHGSFSFPRTPTANGYCMYIKRVVLDEVGFFDAEAFPRGYGEENDFSMRALRAGWSHVVDDSTYVFHERSASFGEAKHELMKHGAAVIDDRYPEYLPLVRQFVGGEGMVAARDRIARLFSAPTPIRPRVLVVLHGGGGGMKDTSQDIAAGLAPRFETLFLRADGRRIRLLASADDTDAIESWTLQTPLSSIDVTSREYAAIVSDLLTRYAIELVHIHHLIGHTLDLPRIADHLGVPVILSAHDYYYVCPSVHLLDGQDVFCGGVCTDGEDHCRMPIPWVRHHASDLKHAGVHTWRRHVQRMLGHVDVVVSPVPTTQSIYRRAFPEVDEGLFCVIEHGRDFEPLGEKLGTPPSDGEPIRILVAGSVEAHKGLEYIESIKALDNEDRIEFHFIGTEDPVASKLGISHGTYDRNDYASIVRSIRPSFAGLFSITAETYSHTLSEAWSVGLPVIATDIGAFHDRISAHGGGWLVDPADPHSAHETILSAAGSPDLYRRCLDQVALDNVRPSEAMVKDYETLYAEVLRGRRTFDISRLDVREPLRLGVIVHGDGVRFTGAAHVRALTRYWHPSLANDVVPFVVDPADYVANPTARNVGAVLVERNALPYELTDSFLEATRQAGIGIVLDLDDDLIDLPRSHPHWASYGTAASDSLRAVAMQADLITVSTPFLAERLQHLNSEVVVVPNMLDDRVWFSPLDQERSGRSPDGALRVLYFGDDSHVRDLGLIQQAFESDSSLRLSLVGVATSATAPPWAEAIDIPQGKRNYPEFVAWLRKVALEHDLAIAPLQDDEWSRSKSDLKFLEATALGLPVLASNTVPYRDTIRHETSGLLVGPTPVDWTVSLAAVAKDPELRERLHRSARDYVTTSRLIGHQAPLLRKMLGRLQRRSA